MLTIKQTAMRESIFAAVGNVIFGSLGTYLALPKTAVLSLLGGAQSAGFGFIPASILFPLTVTLLITHIIKKRVAEGKVEKGFHKIVNWMPKNTFGAGLVIAGACVLVLAPLCIGLIWYVFGSSLSYTVAFGVNVIYMILLALLLVPVIVYRAASL